MTTYRATVGPTERPPRWMRRALDRRVRALVGRLDGAPLDLDPVLEVMVVTDRERMAVRRDAAGPLTPLLASVPPRAGWVTCIVLVGGWSRCAYLRVAPMAPGGVA